LLFFFPPSFISRALPRDSLRVDIAYPPFQALGTPRAVRPRPDLVRDRPHHADADEENQQHMPEPPLVVGPDGPQELALQRRAAPRVETAGGLERPLAEVLAAICIPGQSSTFLVGNLTGGTCQG
jgi:hypothetical protein